MPRKPTGKVVKRQAEAHQKNGDIYIYEREYQHGPVTKKTKRISNKLVPKIPKGGGGMAATRPKRKPGSAPAAGLAASRQHTGLAGILGHAGRASGIDAALIASAGYGAALKTMPIARLPAAAGGDSLPRIETWQPAIPIPYGEGIAGDIYYGLRKAIGIGETFRQSLSPGALQTAWRQPAHSLRLHRAAHMPRKPS
ncbi:MAG: hypothetical protein FWG10_05735 [Eubacteriaceae bacterium]|nr:hypothetical protein [Eubacteriaceae bacterium]